MSKYKTMLSLVYLLFAAIALVHSTVDSAGESYYQAGDSAWKNGQWQSARNAWYKYLQWTELHPDVAADARRTFVQKSLKDMESCLDSSTPLVPVEKIESKKKRPVVHEEQSSRPVSKTASVSMLTRKAALARKQGQLEQSLKLYKIAQVLAPESKEVKEGLADLEKEMN